jgi:hypothetical protein
MQEIHTLPRWQKEMRREFARIVEVLRLSPAREPMNHIWKSIISFLFPKVVRTALKMLSPYAPIATGKDIMDKWDFYIFCGAPAGGAVQRIAVSSRLLAGLFRFGGHGWNGSQCLSGEAPGRLTGKVRISEGHELELDPHVEDIESLHVRSDDHGRVWIAPVGLSPGVHDAEDVFVRQGEKVGLAFPLGIPRKGIPVAASDPVRDRPDISWKSQTEAATPPRWPKSLPSRSMRFMTGPRGFRISSETMLVSSM